MLLRRIVNSRLSLKCYQLTDRGALPSCQTNRRRYSKKPSPEFNLATTSENNDPSSDETGSSSVQLIDSQEEFPHKKGSERAKTRRRGVANLLKDVRHTSESPLKLAPDFPSDITDYYNSKYKDYNDWARDQMKHSYRPKIDPTETSLVLFPGEGNQFVGMGSKLLDYPNVEEMYRVASRILGYDLLEMCLRGPKVTLNKTIHSQPAILVTSLAAVEKLKCQKPSAIENCVSTAGFGVGEYAALVFAGSMAFEDAVQVVKIRAEAMQRASEVTSSGMMTVYQSPETRIKFACHAARLYCSQQLGITDPVCEVSSYLYPECKVVSGNMEALQFIEKNAKEFAIKCIHHLPFTGAFHTRLMNDAVPAVAKELAGVEFNDPIIPVHSNINSFKYKKRDVIAKLLSQQLSKPIKWEQTMHVFYARPQGQGFPQSFEVGPGRQLGDVLRMTNLKAFEHYTKVEV